MTEIEIHQRADTAKPVFRTAAKFTVVCFFAAVRENPILHEPIIAGWRKILKIVDFIPFSDILTFEGCQRVLGAELMCSAKFPIVHEVERKKWNMNFCNLTGEKSY